MAAFDIGALTTEASVQESFVSGLSIEPWRKMDSKDGGGMTLAGISTGGLLHFKGEHMVRLAYRINNTYAKAGKTKATLVLTPKTAAAFLKVEKMLKDKVVSSGMMKASEMKASFQSAIEKTDKYPAHTMKINVRIEAPLTTFFAIEENEIGEKKPVPKMWNDVPKFSLMNARFAPSLIWKGQGGKCAITYVMKVGVCAMEDPIPTPLDEEQLTIDWDELETDKFMDEMDVSGKASSFSPDKFMPKGGKGIKGARGAQPDGERDLADDFFQAKSTKKGASSKKKAADLDADGDDLSAGGGASSTSDKKPAHKRPRKSTKVVDLAPDADAVLAMELEAEEAEESAEGGGTVKETDSE